MTLIRNLLLWILLAAAGVLLAWMALGGDHGHVLVRYGGYDYTTTLVNAIAIGLGIAVALWLVLWLLGLPFRTWSRRRDQQARANLGDGLAALHQGHYGQADKLLAKAVQEPHAEPAARIAVAHAAHARGDRTRARTELDAFGERHPASRAIAAAELALADGRPTDALVALDAPAAQPLPPRGLALRADALAANGQADQAYELLGPLRRQHAMSEPELAEREARWAAATLREARDSNALASHWEALPKQLRTEPAVAAAYADRASALGWDEAATKALEQALAANWDESLAARYGSLPLGRPEHRAAVCERWLESRPDSAALLLSRARLSAQSGQWRHAEEQALRAMERGAGEDAWELLGDIRQAQGDEPGASHAYANALRASRGETPAPLPRGPAVMLPPDDPGPA
ncbi:heme biosynthesis protein HemY [Luteimonas dalianensis]|uniref:heme biosynthesis protein HemY n=1 Tax=Luteimonas dalianensis TaxID=1148196 RepID=UPI003BEFAC3C